MKKVFLAAALAATSISGVAFAAAQDAPAMQGKKHFGPDANQDGIVTRQEAIAASDAMFARMDTNHDGQLSADELKMGRHHRGGRHHRMDPERKKAMMEKFDTNKDGQLSDAEKQAARAAMKEHRQARNGDRKGPEGRPDKGQRQARMMARVDTDKNGSISQAEFRAAAMQRFAKADANNDGRIDKAEREAIHAKMKERRGHGLDRRGDGPPPAERPDAN
ncbi:EF-hand domain-containing protein [Stakelama sp. CBK3Z-3]|uniref:EF-hand domain-containing protein n=1 Tax=Stakelama flava TaxID=2860338 RepID=A0ABS6XJ18_9SPHN|nr:EF-hand domain-containing protein [Stakelama flava]MBW4329401.1 EF-hand domain-containing protein [Stakelama flava]